ncbi:hypothetical protein B9Z55_021104 [Caenorhabditis nigoni]|uniref:F-box domain-containing protein n=1 Tax=Caenorhabditis nigoni TaxID=1611254 RepID=A0A2G5TQH1_9PELO|nr:hypothetical protein B9Z55_021104 [Caenorhabditis nigoni]
MPCKIPASAYSDSATIKHFILYDVLQGIQPDKGFRKLCEILQKELDYPEYEYMYYQFYNGNLEPDMPRSFKGISDLPMDALAEIFGHLEVKNRFIARKVSKSFRDVIDYQKIDYSDFHISITDRSIRFELDDSVFTYSENPLPDFLPLWEPSYVEKTEIVNKDFQILALKDLEHVLLSAKTIQYFKVIFDGSSSKNQFELFSKLMENTKKLAVTEISIREERNEKALKILSFLKPGKLKTISLESTKKNGNLNDLVTMDQFKMAREIHIANYGILDSSLIDQFYGFDKFQVRLEEIRREDVIRIQTALEKLPNAGGWTFYCDNLQRVEVEQAIVQSKIVYHKKDYSRIYYKTKIQNSKYFIRFLFEEANFLIMSNRK